MEIDPLGVTPAITTVIHVASRTVTFLRDVKHGGDILTRLSNEIQFTIKLLETLQTLGSFSANADPWAGNIRMLEGHNGPLVHFEKTLTRLNTLADKGRKNSMTTVVAYPTSKREILDLQDEIERYKSLFKTALQAESLLVVFLNRTSLASVAYQSIQTITTSHCRTARARSERDRRTSRIGE